MSEDQKDKIVRMLEKKGHPMHLRELMKKCKAREKKLFSRDIEELRRQGILRGGKKGMVELAQERTRKKATIVSLSKGFAFARPQDGTEDLFLHADHLQGAMVNDVVELKNIRNSPKGKSAQVASILERAKRSATGTVEKMRDGYVLKPDIAIRYPIPISKKDLQQAKDGDKVLAELYRKSVRIACGHGLQRYMENLKAQKFVPMPSLHKMASPASSRTRRWTRPEVFGNLQKRI